MVQDPSREPCFSTRKMSSLPDEVLFRIAVRFQNELIIAAPVDTGRLRNSIHVTTTEKGLLVTMVDYGMFVEFGTNRQRPNPFIRNTIQIKLNEIVQEEVERHFG